MVRVDLLLPNVLRNGAVFYLRVAAPSVALLLSHDGAGRQVSLNVVLDAKDHSGHRILRVL